jgi:hypothetical protein
MQFKKHARFAKMAFAALTFASLLSGSALAEDAAGKFVLTHPVRWGTVVLAPGEYTYKLEHKAQELLLIRAASGAPGFMVLCTSVSSTAPGTSDSLKLERMGDEWFVSSLSLSELEEELHFRPPASRTQIARTASASKMASLSQP